MRILVVEDEQKLSSIISHELSVQGFDVEVADDGAKGLELATSYSYDVIILDISLPKLNGTEVLAGIRKKDKYIPVIMLTARDAVGDKVKHIEGGADDYLTKPFAFSELFARVKALLRRSQNQKNETIRIADLEVDRLSHQVRRAGKRIELSGKEYALLEYLALNINQPLSRTMIVSHVWDQSFEGLTNIVDVYVRQLRGKIDGGHERRLIKTVRGVGYTLNEKIE